MSKDRVTLEGPKIGQTWRLTCVAEDPNRLVVLVAFTRFVDGHKWFGLVLDDPDQRHAIGTEIFAATASEFGSFDAVTDYVWTRVA